MAKISSSKLDSRKINTPDYPTGKKNPVGKLVSSYLNTPVKKPKTVAKRQVA